MKYILTAFALLLLYATAWPADDTAVPEPTQNPNATYRLFRTQNLYTFLELDTRTGQVWQMQWGTTKNYRLVAPINLVVLAPDGTTQKPTALSPGRFTLNPTSNIYNLLLDQENGKMLAG